MQATNAATRSADQPRTPSVAVVGGGVAGLTAAVEARRRGARVVVFEKLKRLGGRVASIDFGAPCATLDMCQRSIVGDCAALSKLHRELGLESFFSTTSLAALGGEPVEKSPLKLLKWASTSLLPPRLQILPQLLDGRTRTFKDAWNQSKRIRKLAEKLEVDLRAGTRDTVAESLAKVGASQEEIDAFWKLIALAAASETPDRAACLSLKRFVDALASANPQNAFKLVTNDKTLKDVYHSRAANALRDLGVEIRFLSRIDGFVLKVDEEEESKNADGALEIVGVSNHGETEYFDKFVLAVDPFEARSLLERSHLQSVAETIDVESFELASVTVVHLWFDSPVATNRATLLDGDPAHKLMVPKEPRVPLPSAQTDEQKGFYCQAIVCGSHRTLNDDDVVARGERNLVDRVLAQLDRANGATRVASRLLAHRVSTSLEAVVSPTPRFLQARPSQKTTFPNLALAGDWTNADFPASMEGAAKSGEMAIKVLFENEPNL